MLPPLIADKGYHWRDALKALDGVPLKSRIPSRTATGFNSGFVEC